MADFTLEELQEAADHAIVTLTLNPPITGVAVGKQKIIVIMTRSVDDMPDTCCGVPIEYLITDEGDA